MLREHQNVWGVVVKNDTHVRYGLGLSYKFWMSIAVLVMIVAVWVNRYHKLPDNVQANTENIGQLTENVKEVSNQQKTYVEVNEEYKKGQQENKELMLKLIEAKK